jgi:hypothetical protein
MNGFDKRTRIFENKSFDFDNKVSIIDNKAANGRSGPGGSPSLLAGKL